MSEKETPKKKWNKKKIIPAAVGAVLVVALVIGLYFMFRPNRPKETADRFYSLQNEIYTVQSQEEMEEVIRQLYGMQYPSLQTLAGWYDEESEDLFFETMAQTYYDSVKNMGEEQKASYVTEWEIGEIEKLSAEETSSRLDALLTEFAIDVSAITEAYSVPVTVRLPDTEYESRMYVYCLDGKWYVFN